MFWVFKTKQNKQKAPTKKQTTNQEGHFNEDKSKIFNLGQNNQLEGDILLGNSAEKT